MSSKAVYLENLNRILSDDEIIIDHRIRALFSLFNAIVEDLTSVEDIRFTTLFSRCTFYLNDIITDQDSKFYLHQYRRLNEGQGRVDDQEILVRLGDEIIRGLIRGLDNNQFHVDLDDEIRKLFPRDQIRAVDYKPYIRGIVKNIDVDNKICYVQADDDDIHELVIMYDRTGENELFTNTFQAACNVYDYLSLNLIDVTFTEDNTCLPKAIIIDPDYLVDVTSVAESFKYHGVESRLSILRRYEATDTTAKPLLVGNIANVLFDRILSQPSIKWKDVIPDIFRTNAMAITTYDDDQVLEMIADVKNHFIHLKEVIRERLSKVNIDKNKSYLEPSFYSAIYGIQGRLDMFHQDDERKQYDIIELKSGKPFSPNTYGLSKGHYIQTLLYDLLIRSSFGNVKLRSYILYSKIADSLKYAPVIKALQYEAMSVRNDLVLLDKFMSINARNCQQMLESINVERYAKIKGYLYDNIKRFQGVLKKLNEIERHYIYEYSSFLLRELRLSKVGEHGLYNDNGLAALWLENEEEKETRFSLLKGLKILINHSREKQPILTLLRSQTTSQLANFRMGDIAVLYPYSNQSSVLNNQIFKCTIIDIQDQVISIKLRSQQYNDDIFNQYEFWSLEQDSLDSGYNSSFRSLFTFARLAKAKRALLLGLGMPKFRKVEDLPSQDLTEEQNEIVAKALSAEDYYILWGPPGTGKTSIVLRRIVEILHSTSDENVLIVAYTNRAVDEICTAIKSISSAEIDFIRIGSTYGCGVEHRDQLLDIQISGFTQRVEIKDRLVNCRFYVGTIASIVGKQELFKIKSFDRAIIDEASQILEPQMIGLLSRVEKFMLIGDHKQLPAVVQQSDKESQVQNDALRKIGITDMRMSYFERLIHQNKRAGREEAIGILSQQGRMHKELMNFPNDHFYEHKLKTIPKLSRLHRANIKFSSNEYLNHRMIYIPTESEHNIEWKTNQNEAEKIIRTLVDIREQYKSQQLEIHDQSIGIIAPYRAQIAMIKRDMQKQLPELLDRITVDTVERFQGGARDIILISLCTNNARQFSKLVSLSVEGIDRKLNVAITRCKEQLIILGNESVIHSNSLYADLIKRCYRADRDL